MSATHPVAQDLEVAPRETGRCCRLTDVAPVPLHDALDVPPLELFDDALTGERQRQILSEDALDEIAPLVVPGREPEAHVRELTESDVAGDAVVELADVSRPIVVLEAAEHLRRRRAVGAREPAPEVARE